MTATDKISLCLLSQYYLKLKIFLFKNTFSNIIKHFLRFKKSYIFHLAPVIISNNLIITIPINAKLWRDENLNMDLLLIYEYSIIF